MRIAFFNVTASYLDGGLETYCWEAGRAMARRGHDVSIVAGNRGMARHTEVRLLQFPFRAEKEWPKFGVRFRRLAERFSFARHALPWLQREQFDAVIVNKPFDFPLLWWARRGGMRSRTLFRSGGTDFFPGDRRFAGAVDFWVSSSGYNARQVTARYGRQVRTIHNGVDTGIFSPSRDSVARASMGATDRDLLLVSVGRLVGWKGHRIIIESLTEVPTSVRYAVIGDGPERPALEALARARGVSDRVYFTGAMSHDQLPRWLSSCDLFVQPSIGEEAFGISVVEAMACGLPALVSDNGGLPEIVADKVTGLLLPTGDVMAWRAAIGRLLNDRTTLQQMGGAAKQRAETHFTWAANAEQLERILSDSGVRS